MSTPAHATGTPPGTDRPDNMPAAGRATDVLAIATSTTPWSPSLHAGASIARRWCSQLTGCYIDPSLCMLAGPESEPSVLGLLLDTPVRDTQESAAFRAFARERGVPNACWVVAHTGLARALRQLGTWHSLAVLERDIVDEEVFPQLLGEALLISRLPSLILPPGWDHPAQFARVLVAWDGGLEATRAIHAALPLLLDADQVVLLDGGRHAPAPVGYAPPFEPSAYLARHHMEPQNMRVEIPPHAAGAALLEKAGEVGAELLVMGAFGHSPLRERVLGGATRYVLRHATVPVFLAH